MQLKDNPYLKQEDYSKQYNENIEKLKNNPELVELDKLCYELFHVSEMGKRFMEIAVERWLIPPMADRTSPNFPNSAVWAEGFKDAFRMLRSAASSHAQRIKAGEKKQ